MTEPVIVNTFGSAEGGGVGGGGRATWKNETGGVYQESWCSDWTSVHWEGDQALGQLTQSSGHGTKTIDVREVFGQHF